ncbi:MAG: hypothetical protein H0W34_14115, partial [Pyrinomonadaceae bacterium]|nr:hypothetical protein [Pyrinomonadaceae bacterium]
MSMSQLSAAEWTDFVQKLEEYIKNGGYSTSAFAATVEMPDEGAENYPLARALYDVAEA